MGRLPDHIDSHHHVHWISGFKPVVLAFAKKHAIPVRCQDAKFEMGFYGRSFKHWNDPNNVTYEKLITVLENLSPGVHEIMCHPGYVDDELKATKTTYLYQREQEVKALTSPRVREYIKQNVDIKLISWKDISFIR
jgi:predicted glycoside hydrolase/deacetylase ChbG (UPF0249 family)